MCTLSGMSVCIICYVTLLDSVQGCNHNNIWHATTLCKSKYFLEEHRQESVENSPSHCIQPNTNSRKTFAMYRYCKHTPERIELTCYNNIISSTGFKLTLNNIIIKCRPSIVNTHYTVDLSCHYCYKVVPGNRLVLQKDTSSMYIIWFSIAKISLNILTLNVMKCGYNNVNTHKTVSCQDCCKIAPGN